MHISQRLLSFARKKSIAIACYGGMILYVFMLLLFTHDIITIQAVIIVLDSLFVWCAILASKTNTSIYLAVRKNDLWYFYTLLVSQVVVIFIHFWSPKLMNIPIITITVISSCIPLAVSLEVKIQMERQNVSRPKPRTLVTYFHEFTVLCKKVLRNCGYLLVVIASILMAVFPISRWPFFQQSALLPLPYLLCCVFCGLMMILFKTPITSIPRTWQSAIVTNYFLGLMFAFYILWHWYPRQFGWGYGGALFVVYLCSIEIAIQEQRRAKKMRPHDGEDHDR